MIHLNSERRKMPAVGKILGVEVKTEPRGLYYPDTGFNVTHYNDYKRLCEENSMRIYVCFVDPMLKKIYGNYLDVLEEKRSVDGLTYSMYGNDRGTFVRIIYFPLEAMEDMRSFRV